MKLHEKGMYSLTLVLSMIQSSCPIALGPDYQIFLYPGSGTADSESGDHLIIAPPFNASEADIRWIADTVEKLIIDYFDELNSTEEGWYLA
jgi:hypothetical protein